MAHLKLHYYKLFSCNLQRNVCHSCFSFFKGGELMSPNNFSQQSRRQMICHIPISHNHNFSLNYLQRKHLQKSCLIYDHSRFSTLGLGPISSSQRLLSKNNYFESKMSSSTWSWIKKVKLQQRLNSPHPSATVSNDVYNRCLHTGSLVFKSKKEDASSESSSSDSESDSGWKKKDADIDEFRQQISSEKGKEDADIDLDDLKKIIHEIKEDFKNVSSEKDMHDPSARKKSSSDEFSSEYYGDPDENEYLKSLENDDQNFSYYEVAEDIEEYDYMDESEMQAQQIRPEKVLPITLEHGENGVFDLEELLTFLDHLGALDVVTIPIPPEAQFCDHMVIASVKSARHMQAIQDEFLWVHKRKRAKKDAALLIEGKDKNIWSAMDMGNIVLHLFYGEAREYYDIESLWTLGPENDPKCQEQNINPYELSPEDLFWLDTSSGTDNVIADEIEVKVPPKDGPGKHQQDSVGPQESGH